MFELTTEQSDLYAMANDFAEKEVWPRARDWDLHSTYPVETLKKAHELGLLNAFVPEECGGLGLHTLEACLLSEAMGSGSSGFSTALGANELAAMPVIVSGEKDIWKRFLAPMVEEPQMAAYCVTEPGAGSDVAGIRTTARKQGDGYVLNGSKMWITNAGYAKWFFVLAKTDLSAGAKGMTGFVVPADANGVLVGKKEDNMGQRCSDTRGVTFQDVFVSEKNRLGAEGQGFRLAMAAFDRTRPAVAANAVGLAARALKCSVQYAKERHAFGGPIAENQAIAFMLADMARDIEASRLMCWKAAADVDAGRRNTYFASIAKLLAGDSVMRITTDAVQIFGGYGYNKEYPVEMLMRDAKIFQIYEGTSQIQRLVISRHLLAE